MKQVLSECNPSGLVPPIMAPTARVVSIDWATKMSSNGGWVYTYKVKCSTDKESDKEKKKEEEKPVELIKKTSSMIRVAGKIRCDGPCHRTVDVSSTSQFGCDHSICKECRQNSQSIACFDGSPGCCNEACVALGRAEGAKTRAGPRDSVQSVVSSSAPVESLHIHVAIVKCYGRDVLRNQLDFEFPSTARISSLVKALAHYKDLLDKSRFYYSLEKPKTRDDLETFSLTETHLRFYDIAEPTTQDIYFLVVGAGIGFF